MPQHAPDELDPGVDWITTREVAELLGVTRTRVGHLVRREYLPAVMHEGRYYFRRHQVEAVGNAREARRIGGPLG